MACSVRFDADREPTWARLAGTPEPGTAPSPSPS